MCDLSSVHDPTLTSHRFRHFLAFPPLPSFSSPFINIPWIFWPEPKLEAFGQTGTHSCGWHKWSRRDFLRWIRASASRHLTPFHLHLRLLSAPHHIRSVLTLVVTDNRNPLDRCDLMWRGHGMVVETVATVALSQSMSMKRKMTNVGLQRLLNLSPSRSCIADLMTWFITDDDCASHVAEICTVCYHLLLPSASLLTIARWNDWQTLKGQFT